MKNASVDKNIHDSIFSELNQNKQVIKYLLENAPMGIALLDAEGYYKNVNKRFADNIGYSVKDVTGLHLSEITCPLFYALDVYQYSKLRDKKVDFLRHTKQFYSSSGEAVDLCIEIFPLNEKESGNGCFIGFYQSCRPFYEDYLKQMNPGIKLLQVDNLSPGILIFSRDCRVLYGSKSAANYLGYTEKQISNLIITDLIINEQVERIFSLIWSQEPFQGIECELRFLHLDGRIVPVQLEIFIDDTDYFRNGRMMIFIFKNRSVFKSQRQTYDLNGFENNILMEVRALKDCIKSLNEDKNKEHSTKHDIKLSDYSITSREKDVLTLCLARKNTKEIAYELNLAEITIRKHFTSIYRKFGVGCREDLLIMLYGKNLI